MNSQTWQAAVAEELVQHLDVEGPVFDENGRMLHDLPWGMKAEFCVDQESRTLLVGVWVGELADISIAERCLLLLMVNHASEVTAGGTLGLDLSGQQVSFCRSFVLPASVDRLAECLGGLDAFLASSQVAGQLVTAVNCLHFDEQVDDFVVGDATTDDLSQFEDELAQFESSEQLSEEPNESSDDDELQRDVQTFHSLIQRAFEDIGWSDAQPEGDAYYLTDDDVEAEVSYDHEFGEIAFTALCSPPPGVAVVRYATGLLQQCCFLKGTGGCVLGVEDESQSLSLTFRFPVAVVENDSNSLQYLIANFWNHAAEFSQIARNQIETTADAPATDETPIIRV